MKLSDAAAPEWSGGIFTIIELETNINMKKLLNSTKTRAFVVIIVADSFFYTLVNPTISRPIVVIAGCFLLIATIYIVIGLFVSLLTIFIPSIAKSQKSLIILGTVFIGFIILMQSIGQLSVQDVLAVVPLIAILYFYSTRLLDNKNQS